jgi:excisionase family DNA binding protein
MNRDIYMRSREAAAYIGVCFRTLQAYIADGIIPCTKPAGRWIFKKRDLDDFLNNNRH